MVVEKAQEAEERRKRLLCYASRGPGPAIVMLPPTVGYMSHDKTRRQFPAYSLGLKLKSTLLGDLRSPGPNYLVPTGTTAKGPYHSPAFSITSRKPIRGDINRDGPGPAAYNPAINLNRRRAPAYSLSSRNRIIEKGYFSPGPIYMLPPALGPKVVDRPAAPEVTLKGRGKDPKSMTETAGFYGIGSPDIIKNCAGYVTLKSRHYYKEKGHYAAGPASYNLQNAVNKIRPTPPAYSLGIRHTECAGTFFTQCDKDDGNQGSCSCGVNNNEGTC